MPENDADGDNQRRRRVGPLLRTPLEVAITVLVFAGVSGTFIYLRSMHENAFLANGLLFMALPIRWIVYAIMHSRR